MSADEKLLLTVDMSYDDRLSIYYKSYFNDIAQTYCCIVHRLLHLLLLYTCKAIKSTDSKEIVSNYVFYLQWIQSMKDPRDVVTLLLYIPDLNAICSEAGYARWMSLLYVNIADSYRRSFASRCEDIISSGISKLHVRSSVPETHFNTILDYNIIGRMLESIRDEIYNSTLPIDTNVSDRIVWMLQGEHRIDIRKLLHDGATEICRPLMLYDDMNVQYNPKDGDGKHVLIKMRERSSTTTMVKYLHRTFEIDVEDYTVNANLYVELHRPSVDASTKGSLFIALSPDEQALEPKPRFIYKYMTDVLIKYTKRKKHTKK